MDFSLNKKGQMIIFVIVAMLLVASIIIIFLIFRSPQLTTRQSFEDPESFLDTCVRDSLREKIDIMIPQGGFVNPTDYVIYNDIKTPYLCKNINYYEPCITQYPRYITRLQEELEFYITEDIQSCFILFEEELDKRNYQHSGGDLEIEVTLKPGVIETLILRDFTFSRDGSVRTFDSFDISLRSPLYDLAYIANEITSQEARYCYFEYVGHNILYNKFDIKKDTMSDSTKVYSILHKPTQQEMNIATRGCVIPAGF